MALHLRLNRRLILPFALALILAGEVTGIALAARVQPAPTAQSATAVSSVHETLGRTIAARAHASSVASIRDDSAVVKSWPPVAESRVRSTSGAAAMVRPVVASTVTSKSIATTKTSTAASAASKYHGRNHVWIPTLGINRSVSSFPCSRSRPPDNFVYRWGCAGRNNVYLLGHAYSVFKPLHDAYISGRLRKGMKVVYADGSGHVRTYAVTWWKVTAPTTSASWAWAAQSRPSMTLQTCVGAHSAYRLIVRLVAVG
jgi:hypothetical protein